jgi:hypothetical protein
LLIASRFANVANVYRDILNDLPFWPLRPTDKCQCLSLALQRRRLALGGLRLDNLRPK